ncbi:hypothetical protein H9Q78_13115 [Qiania dongpingensis]|uniref:Uncharacterized protein n=2 Tax=Qiania dongpingensis TaxID=2763669 RepID=A0A7G9G8E3_9FIRM|nr:hypothetical protein H9Q78_13115 [Qiania dongpingensis]
MLRKQTREVCEAIEAGEQALYSLKCAEDQLGSARGWGVWDMFGGGFFASLIKHSKIDDAREEIERAKLHLLKFQKELSDIQVPMEFKVEIGSFLTFADFFFDGLVADWMVQSRIQEAREQVEDARMRVEEILMSLRSWYSGLCLEDRR